MMLMFDVTLYDLLDKQWFGFLILIFAIVLYCYIKFKFDEY